MDVSLCLIQHTSVESLLGRRSGYQVGTVGDTKANDSSPLIRIILVASNRNHLAMLVKNMNVYGNGTGMTFT